MLFGASRLADPSYKIMSETLILRPPAMEDFTAWSSLRGASRAFLEPWEPAWLADDLAKPSFRRRLRRYNREMTADEAVTFLVFARAGGALLGGLTIGNIRRGVAQMATLGYWMGERHAGKGVMTEAVTLACRFGFARMGLRRIEAACLPENAASVRLLEKAGFRPEGKAREYLCIAGRWRDHLLFARLAADAPVIAPAARLPT